MRIIDGDFNIIFVAGSGFFGWGEKRNGKVIQLIDSAVAEQYQILVNKPTIVFLAAAPQVLWP